MENHTIVIKTGLVRNISYLTFLGTMSDYISLSHGNGGRFMRELITQVFAKHLHNSYLDTDADAVNIGQIEGNLLFSVDGFTVQPLSFPGGDIGALAAHGTLNDLAVSGAKPLYLTLSAIIEEGLPIAELESYVQSLAKACTEADVKVIAGDTKIVPRGSGGGLYLSTSGVGRRLEGLDIGLKRIEVGDKILVSGSIGDHGTCVMLAREEFGLSGQLRSDAASVLPLTLPLAEIAGVHFMRDPTRGGLATVAHEIAEICNTQVYLQQAQIPVKGAVQSVCDILGYDPYYLACEGRVVAIVAPDAATEVLARWQQTSEGKEAAIIGEIQMADSTGAKVVLETELGGTRILEALEDEPLPRIC